MTTALAKRPRVIEAAGFLQSKLAMLPALIKKHASPESLAQTAIVAMTRQPKLIQAAEESPATFLMAIVRSHLLDLDLNTDEAALVPFKNKYTKKLEATLIPMYQGLMKLARKSREVFLVKTRLVYEGDDFKCVYGIRDTITMTRGENDTDETITHVYAVALLANGEELIEVMTRKQVDKIRASAPGRNSDAWVNNYGEMARKTVVRRICKYLPKTNELSKALQLENDSYEGISTPLEVEGQIVDIADDEPPPASASEKLAGKLGAPKNKDIPEPPPPSDKPLAKNRQALVDAILKLHPTYTFSIPPTKITISELRAIRDGLKSKPNDPQEPGDIAYDESQEPITPPETPDSSQNPTNDAQEQDFADFVKDAPISREQLIEIVKEAIPASKNCEYYADHPGEIDNKMVQESIKQKINAAVDKG